MADVFISYEKSDAEAAARIVRRLEAAGVIVHMPTADANSDQTPADRAARISAPVMLAVCSTASHGNAFILHQWQSAAARKALLVVQVGLLGEAGLDANLRNAPSIDVIGALASDTDPKWAALLDEVAKLIAMAKSAETLEQQRAERDKIRSERLQELEKLRDTERDERRNAEDDRVHEMREPPDRDRSRDDLRREADHIQLERLTAQAESTRMRGEAARAWPVEELDPEVFNHDREVLWRTRDERASVVVGSSSSGGDTVYAPILPEPPRMPPPLATPDLSWSHRQARANDPRINFWGRQRFAASGAWRGFMKRPLAFRIGVGIAAAALLAFIFKDAIGGLFGAAMAPGSSTPSRDRVEASVFAPYRCVRGQASRVQVFLNTRAGRDEARDTAMGFDPGTQLLSRQSLATDVERGETLDIVLQPFADAGGRVDIRSTRQSVTWDGEPTSVDFLLLTKADAPTGPIGFAAIVFRSGKPIGELTFMLSIAVEEQPQTAPPPAAAPAAAAPVASPARSAVQPIETEAKPYRRIFFSYSRADSEQVALVARSFEAVNQDFFWDVRDQTPGDRWEQQLYAQIENADLFILFWSESAKKSDMVHKEVEHALKAEAAKGKPRFVPFPLDGPPPPLPWDDIASRHIGDPIYYRIVQQVRTPRIRRRR